MNQSTCFGFFGKNIQEKFPDVRINKRSKTSAQKERIEAVLKDFKNLLDQNSKIFQKNIYKTESGEEVQINDYLEKEYENKYIQFEDNFLLVSERRNTVEIEEKFECHFENIRHLYTKTKLENEKINQKKNKVSCFSLICSSKKEKKAAKDEKKKNLSDFVKEKEGVNGVISTNNNFGENFNNNHEIKVAKKDNIVYELAEISFSICVDFYLTSDPLMGFLKYKKEGLNPCFHLISYDISSDAYHKEINFLDFQIRTNLIHLMHTNRKNIKLPILMHGNVYFPNLAYFRNSSNKLLECPIVIPSVLLQIFPDDYDQHEKLMNINSSLILEGFEITDLFNHDTIIVNLVKNDEAIYLLRMITFYVEMFVKKTYCNIKNIVFVTDLNYDSFCGVLQHQNIADIFDKNKLKYRVFSD